MMRLLTYFFFLLTAASATAVDVPWPDRELWPQSPQARQIAQVVLFSRGGSAYYYLTDYQGNNIAVVDAAGSIIQRTDYYPYGEPWRYPDGQPYLFSDKELTRADGRHAYTFPARTLLPSLPRWTTPDPLAEQNPWDSPYAYCAANPIANIDPTGENYTVIIDFYNQSIIIQARFFAGQNSIDVLRKATAFWEKQSNKYSFLGLPIQFQFQIFEVEPQPERSEQGLAIGYACRDGELSNSFTIVDKIENEDENYQTNGRTWDNRKVHVSEESPKIVQTSMHEIGHCFGLLHSSTGLMTPSMSDSGRSEDLTYNEITSIISNAFLNINKDINPELKTNITIVNPLSPLLNKQE